MRKDAAGKKSLNGEGRHDKITLHGLRRKREEQGRSRMKKKGRAATAAVVLLLCAGYLFYTRPVALGQIYPMLEAGECVGISGFFSVGSQQERSEFAPPQGSEAFEEVLGLLYDCRYRRTLRDLLVHGTRTHAVQPGDFQWELWLAFEGVELPDGGVGSGPMLHVQYWYGELDFHFNGQTRSYRAKDEMTWAADLLEAFG